MKRIALEQNEDGDLESCDGTGQCSTLPNPNGCDVLALEIDPQSGASCEECVASDGQIIYQTCEDTSVDCVVVSVPDPDCVVCAYIDGAIIYSSCTAAAPICEDYPGTGGVACEGGPASDCGEPVCSRCYDDAGRVTYDSCAGQCELECPPCDEGFVRSPLSNECCGECVPEDTDCDMVVCPAFYPVCPEGTSPQQDPSDCCGFICVGDGQCPTEACGPQLGMPNYVCEDGQTVAGPTGRCLPTAGGACGWEIVECPSQADE